jgi:GNAT superfamily N-acetyltransferase
MNFLTLKTSQGLEPFLGSSLYTGFTAEMLEAQQIDAHLIHLAADEPVARCSLWWTNTPPYKNECVGFIGHFESQSPEATNKLLEEACQLLERQGCTLAIGPLDGTTWRRYRFVTESPLGAPHFFLEPTHPADYPQQWLSSGFTPLAQYTSALQPSLEPSPEINQRMEKLVNSRLAKAGIGFRSLDVNRLEQELEIIFDISLKSFASNFLFSPISKIEFLGSYQKILPFALPELVLFAELEGQAIGYVFGMPDVLQKQRGETLDTFIVKTLAVLPEHMNKGLGSVLTYLVTQKALGFGFKKAIHALILETNQSQSISERFSGQLLRRYTLYAKSLS